MRPFVNSNFGFSVAAKAAAVLAVLVISFEAFAGDQIVGSVKSGGQKELVLNLWRIPPKGSNDLATKADRAVFDLFLQRNPHINVKILVPLKIQGPVAEGNEFLAVAGGMAPDVFFLYGRKVGDYIDQGFLAPLNERFKSEFSSKGKTYDGVKAPDKIWETCVRGGIVYAVPVAYSFMALQYRKDLFRKAGLDPMHGPKDWNELWETGKRLTVIPSKELDSPEDQLPVYGFALPSRHRGWHFIQYVFSGGGQAVRSYKECPGCHKDVPVRTGLFPYAEYGIGLLNAADYGKEIASCRMECPDCHRRLEDVREVKWRLVTNEEGGVAALELYRKIVTQQWLRCQKEHEHREFDITPDMEKKGIAVCPICGKGYDLASDVVRKRIYKGIARGVAENERGARFETAMTMQYIRGDISNIDFTKWSLTTFPVRPGCEPRSYMAGSCLGVNVTSPPDHQEAAWQYIKFMTGEEAQRIRVKTMVENGMAQYVPPVLLKQYGYMDYYRQLPAEWIKINEDVSKAGEIEPYCKGFSHVMTVKLSGCLDKAVLYQDRSCAEVMEETCKEVNTQILGARPREEMRRYEFIAYGVIAAVLLLFMLGLWHVTKEKMKGQQAPGITGNIPGMSNRRKTLYAWSFLSIAILSVAVWQYYPLMRGSLMAFQDFKILTGGSFVGPSNFIDVLLEKNFYQFLYQTFLYVSFSIVMGFAAPIILAVLLSEISRGGAFFRTIYYLPAVTTGLVTMFLWKQLMFDPAPDGALNSLLAIIGIPPQAYLESPALAMVCIIIPGIWAQAGPGCLIYLAAFKCIPEDQYEAADLDGAGFFRKAWHIMIPNIRALILINLLGAFVGAFQASENIFVMTGGGPVDKTMTVGLDIWYHSFMYLNFGYATAEAWIFGSMLIGFTVIQLRVLSKVEFKRAGVAGGK